MFNNKHIIIACVEREHYVNLMPDTASNGAGGPVNTKHLYNICTMLDQRRRRWAGVVQMLYKCFEFAAGTLIQQMHNVTIIVIMAI